MKSSGDQNKGNWDSKNKRRKRQKKKQERKEKKSRKAKEEKTEKGEDNRSKEDGKGIGDMGQRRRGSKVRSRG